MTIHADWIKILKSWAPSAFTPHLPIAPEAAFIDGQIKLMGMPHGDGIAPSWDLFLRAQFINPIERHWRYVPNTSVQKKA
jgi:hypothetical protein